MHFYPISTWTLAIIFAANAAGLSFAEQVGLSRDGDGGVNDTMLLASGGKMRNIPV